MLRHVLVRIMRTGYRLIARSPARRLLSAPLVQPVRRRLIGMRGADVLEVLEALKSAGVHAWLVGGWGIDALLGERTRDHADLDLAFEDVGNARERVREALARLGFGRGEDGMPGGGWLPVRIVFRDRAGHTVDLHPVVLNGSTAHGHEDPGRGSSHPSDAVVIGSLNGRQVPCLSPALQILFHQGYEPRASDRHDIARLCAHFGLPTPAEFR